MSDLNRQQLCAKEGRTELYRHFDKDGALLYVGISMATARRLGEHRSGSAWFKKITTITIERFPTRKAALKAERQAVQTENPKHNVTGVLRGFRHGLPAILPREPWKVEVDAIMDAARREIAEREPA